MLAIDDANRLSNRVYLFPTHSAHNPYKDMKTVLFNIYKLCPIDIKSCVSNKIQEGVIMYRKVRASASNTTELYDDIQDMGGQPKRPTKEWAYYIEKERLRRLLGLIRNRKESGS